MTTQVTPAALAARRYEREDLAWIEVGGEDRLSFLHAMLTNTVLGLKVGEGNHSLLLSEKGKLVAELRVLVLEDSVLLVCDCGAREALLETLDHYLVAEDVELMVTPFRAQQLVGARARGVLEAWCGGPAPTQAYQKLEREGLLIVAWPLGPAAGGSDSRESRALQDKAEWSPGMSHRMNHSLSWMLAGPEEHWGSLVAGLQDVPLASSSERERMRVAAAEPAWGAELGPDRFPQEVGLDACLHAGKGCYLGQETMVRIQTQGHVNWCLVALEVEGEGAQVGDAIFAAEPLETPDLQASAQDPQPASGAPNKAPGHKPLGWITSLVSSPISKGRVGLARLRTEAATEGAVLACYPRAKSAAANGLAEARGAGGRVRVERVL